MTDFTPDDDRSDDAWDSFEDYLDDRRSDMEYPDSVPEDVQTDRIEVDPDLFGEWPDGTIEVVSDEGNGLVSGQAAHRWEREATFVTLTGACPHCDGPVSKTEMESPSGDVIVRQVCQDCDTGWVTNRDKGFTGTV